MSQIIIKSTKRDLIYMILFYWSDLSNHSKVSLPKRGKTNSTNNVKAFHARFSVLSALRSPIKLKLWNCSHRHHFEKIVHRGSMIEVIIPEDCFILFSCGLVHCGTPLWFINRGEYGKKPQELFLPLLKQIVFE